MLVAAVSNTTTRFTSVDQAALVPDRPGGGRWRHPRQPRRHSPGRVRTEVVTGVVDPIEYRGQEARPFARRQSNQRATVSTRRTVDAAVVLHPMTGAHTVDGDIAAETQNA